MKKTTISCDICGLELHSEIEDFQDEFGKKLQVIFTTEQTEGKSCAPHLCMENIDICKACYKKVLEGKAIFAHGAQGFNTYYFQGEKK